MGGGGGKGGGKGGNSGRFQIPQEIREGQLEIANVAEQQFRRQQPLVQESAVQLREILNTGGAGARVPIIQNAVEAQESALTRARTSLGEGTERGAITGPVANRLDRQLEREAGTAIRSIGPSIAGPLATANITNAFGAGQGALAGFQTGIGALARGNTRSDPRRKIDIFKTGAQAEQLFSRFGAAKDGPVNSLPDQFSFLTPQGGFGPGIGTE